MNANTAPAPDTATSDNAAFEFVKSLAVELSGGKIELPAFPEVAVRVRRALAEDRTTLDQVVRIVGSEPALAARLLKLANSAALNRSGKQVTDLRTAINRMGYNMVRSAAISFAMAQIRQAAPLKVLSTHLRELWTASTQVAAFCFVLGRRTRINPDEALLVGLLHGIGKLYILTRAGKHPHLFNDEAALSAVVRDWHAGIGKAILESWGFADALVAAINDQEDIGREHVGPADLTDVLICGNMMAAFVDHPEDLELNMQDVAAFRRLNLDADSCREVMKDSKAEIEALRQALGT